jgi:hypothetical protein
MAQTNCRIDKAIYDRLAFISELTSVPISRLIADACEHWVDVQGVIRLARVYEEIKRMPAGFRRTPAEKAPLQIVEEETGAEDLGQKIRWNLSLNEMMRQKSAADLTVIPGAKA